MSSPLLFLYNLKYNKTMILYRQKQFAVDISSSSPDILKQSRRKKIAEALSKPKIAVQKKIRDFRLNRNARQETRELGKLGFVRGANGNFELSETNNRAGLNKVAAQAALDSIRGRYADQAAGINSRYREKKIGILSKARSKYRYAPASSVAGLRTSVPSTISQPTASAVSTSATAASTTSTPNQQQNQSVLSNLWGNAKNTWNNMSQSNKNIAKGAGIALLAGGAIMAARKKKLEEEERRRNSRAAGGKKIVIM